MPRVKVALYGGKPALEAFLAGYYDVVRVDNLQEAPADAVLVVGEDSVDEPGALQTVLDRRRGSVVVLKQDNEEFSGFLGLGHERAGGAPGESSRFLKAGLYAPSYDEGLHALGIDDYNSPDGTDASYFDPYIVPLHDSVTPPDIRILFAGQRLHHVPCLRYELAEGNDVFCQMPLEDHLATDGRAGPILARFVELSRESRPASAPGGVYTDSAELREKLAGYGFELSETPEKARLCVVGAEAYAKDSALQGVKDALLYGVPKTPIELDGRRAKASPSTGFITFAVLPGIPGLEYLTAANFSRISDGTINKEGGFKIPVPILGLSKSQRAVFGRRLPHRQLRAGRRSRVDSRVGVQMMR